MDSDRINTLSAEAERFFVRLILVADDYGRFDGREPVLKARLFPLMPNVRTPDISRWVEECAGAKDAEGRPLLVKYVVNGRPYVEIQDFNQRLRAKTSKFPEIPKRRADDGQVPVMRRLDTESDTESKSESKNHLPENGAGFENFWAVYPRKVAKIKALQVWKHLKPSTEAVEAILKAVELHKTTEGWVKDGGKFIPHPTTWLNQRRWEDEVKPAAPGFIGPWSPGFQAGPVDYVVKVYREALAIPEGDRDAWNRANWESLQGPAAKLLAYIGTPEAAGDCIAHVFGKFSGKGLTLTLGTVLKHAHEFKNGGNRET